MSSCRDAIFNVYYGGKLETHEDGVVMYNGGEVHTIETPPETLFSVLGSGLPVTLYKKKILFKLPFQELREAKVLCSGGESFRKMCDAVYWTRAAELFIESEPGAHVGDSQYVLGYEGEGAPVEESDEEYRFEENDEATRVEESDEEYRFEEYEEATRVENNVSDFVDEEEHDVSHDTPSPSDCEDEPEVMPYEQWRKGSGELKIRQLFSSIEEFKEAVLEYALQGGWNIKTSRYGQVKSEAVCGVKGDCKWKIYCSYEDSCGQWMVKTFQDEHTCIKDGHCKMLKEKIIAKLFLNEVRKDPNFTPKVIQEQIQERYNFVVSYDQCKNAKRRALRMVQREHDEQYERMKDYNTAILESNPGSTTELRTVEVEEGLEVFDRFYVCFAALRNTWVNHCRPIFGIDGCFLKTTDKGQLLAAVGRDANNQIYPIAWAVVKSENHETWEWFIEKLKTDLCLGNGEGFTVISDRQKGLIIAVDKVLPNVEHRMCARHIYQNLKRVYPKMPRMKSLFWRVVESYNEADYNASLEEVKKYDVGVYEAMLSKNLANCSRAFFESTSCCDDVLNNFSESYNNTLKKARTLPLIEMFETMRRQAMIRIEFRKTKAMNQTATFSPKVGNVIKIEEKERKWCSMAIPGPTGFFEVVENRTAYTVNMDRKTCACRRWDLSGIPCRHGLRVVLDRKTHKVENLVSDWFLTTKWQLQYADTIMPLNGMKFWKKTVSNLEAPLREVSKGRKRNHPKRFKGVNESPTKGKKVTRHGRVMRCSRCGLTGHNILKCVNGGVPLKPRKGARSIEVPTECDVGEGPTQPSQPSQATNDDFDLV